METTDSLVACLANLGLLEPAQQDELPGFVARFSSPRELCRHLLQKDWLTAFQINQVMLGRGKHLLLGPYVLVERLGAGGMGEVFKARHRRLHRIAAVKVVARDRLDNRAAVERFKREVEAAAQLSHPNIVAVHDAGEEGDAHYLAMEYIDGIDLGRLLVAAGPLPVSLACDFVRQGALGLHHAHEQGFVHRDIKPQNLLVAPRGGMSKFADVANLERYLASTTKILDMGLIRLQPERVEKTELALTQKGIVLGTLDYLSPEQAMNSHRVDHRADIYSLGCTLYHLLTGQPPFPGTVVLDKLLRHRTEEPIPVRDHRPDTPRELEQVIRKMMAKHPDDRYQTANEVATALLSFANLPLGTVIVTSPPDRNSPPMPLTIDGLEPGDDLAPTRVVEILEGPAERTTLVVPPSLPRTHRRKSLRQVRVERLGWLIAGIVGLALLGLLLRIALREPKKAARTGPEARPAVDHLETYVPPDSVGVVFAQPGLLLTAAILRGKDEARGNVPIDPGVAELLTRIGVDPVLDVRWIRFCFPGARLDQALWLAQGTFREETLRRSGLSLVPSAKDGKRALYRHVGPGARSVFVGLHGRYLVVSHEKDRVEATLEHARTGKDGNPTDAVLVELLRKVDRQQTLWLAISSQKMLPLPRLARDRGTDDLLQLLVEKSHGIHGGLLTSKEMHASLVVEALDDESADRINEKLKAYRTGAVIAVGLGKLFKTRPTHQQKLWFLLTSESLLARDGSTIRVLGKVKPEMLAAPP